LILFIKISGSITVKTVVKCLHGKQRVDAIDLIIVDFLIGFVN